MAQQGRGEVAVRGVLIAAAIVAIVVGLIWGFQRRLIYLPMPAQAPAAEDALPDADEVELITDDGLALGGWLLAPDDDDDLGIAALVANGNAGHRGLRAPLAQALADEGLTVLLFDYRGFGGNDGSPSEDGLASDVRAARSYLVEDRGFSDARLVYYGESIGTGVVAGLALEHPPGGLALRSPFPDLATVGRRHYPFLPVRTLLWDRYPVAQQVAQIDVPTVVIYGEADSIIPPALSREVAAAAAGPVETVAVPGADHNDRALLDGDQLIEGVASLARRLAER